MRKQETRGTKKNKNSQKSQIKRIKCIWNWPAQIIEMNPAVV